MRTEYDYYSLCPNCGSEHIKWHSTVNAIRDVLDGSLRSNELTPVFYLGCDTCSETIATLSGDDVAEILNGRKK